MPRPKNTVLGVCAVIQFTLAMLICIRATTCTGLCSRAVESNVARCHPTEIQQIVAATTMQFTMDGLLKFRPRYGYRKFNGVSKEYNG